MAVVSGLDLRPFWADIYPLLTTEEFKAKHPAVEWPEDATLLLPGPLPWEQTDRLATNAVSETLFVLGCLCCLPAKWCYLPIPYQQGQTKAILTWAKAPKGGGRLYLDAMNCAEWFFGGGEVPQCHESAVRAMPGRVRDFVEAAALSGFDNVAAFIDAARITDEAQEKWRERRLVEVGNLIVPQWA